MSRQIQTSKERERELKPKTEGILLKCPHTSCGGRIWNYRGNMKVYAVCPDCRQSIKISENQVQIPTNTKEKQQEQV